MRWLLLSLLLIPSVHAQDLPIVRDVVYGHKDGMALTFDVLKPAKANGAAVIFIPTGGWFSVWREPETMKPACQPFLDKGFTVFLVYHGSAPKYNIPEIVPDCRRAVRFIRMKAKDYSIDPERIGVFGGSAGGHLTLMLATTADDGDPKSKDKVLQQSSRITAAVALFPPTDIREWVTNPPDLIRKHPAMIALTFDAKKAKDFSPLLHVSDKTAPTLLIHGDKDELVPISHSTTMIAALEKAKVPSKLMTIEGAAHGFNAKQNEVVVPAMVGWFEKHLIKADTPGLKNGGFEDGEAGKSPAEWIFPKPCIDAGYTLKLIDEKPFAGKLAAEMARDAAKDPEGFGNVMQYLDAKPWRGKRVRFKAAVRTVVLGEGNQAMLWFRVDRPKDAPGFFDNMSDRPITASGWKHYEIVGDIADDADQIYLGLLLLGSGKVCFDDCSLEVVDLSVKTTGVKPRVPSEPGLFEVHYAADVTAAADTAETSFLYPLPLSYRDQVPLTFQLQVNPPEHARSAEILQGPGPNRVLKLTLANLKKNKKVTVAYQSLVLVRPTSWVDVPKTAMYPREWPADVKPWLKSTWCCDHDNDRIAAIAKEIRGDRDDVMEVIKLTLERSQKIFGEAKGRVKNLTAIEALDKQGSCTSCANLVAALLRGADIPARVIAGYPLWSGPLQTHYIVEAWVPGYGWYPVESTMGKSPWPNHEQVNVSIVPVEHEAEAKAKQRRQSAGAVPYMSLTERPDDDKSLVFAVGTLGKYCDHEARFVRGLKAGRAEWDAAFKAVGPRWERWTKDKVEVKDGTIAYGEKELKAEKLAEVLTELKGKN